MPQPVAPRNRAGAGIFTFPSLRAPLITSRMKVILASIVLAGAGVLLSGCETDLAPDSTKPNPAEKFQRGATGQGSLSQPDRSEDPVIRENTRVGY